MDILFFMSGKHGQKILETVCDQLNQKYRALIHKHPGCVLNLSSHHKLSHGCSYDGKVSILGHSLGSVIVYILLNGMEAPGGAAPPALEFGVGSLSLQELD